MELTRALRGHAAPVLCVAWDGVSGALASGGADRAVLAHAPCASAPARRHLGHTGPVTCLAYAPDGGALYSGGEDAHVRVWAPSARSVCDALRAHHGPVRAVDPSHDGRHLLTAGDDKLVKLWDARSLRFLRSYSGHVNWVRSAVCHPAGAPELASGGDDTTVVLWDAEVGARKAVWREHVGAVTCVRFSPDGSALASCGADCSVSVWDCRSRARIQQHAAHSGAVTGLAFHPSGLYLASCALDGVVRTWDLRAGRALGAFAGTPQAEGPLAALPHPRAQPCGSGSGSGSSLRAVSYSPDGALLAVGGDSLAVCVWAGTLPLANSWLEPVDASGAFTAAPLIASDGGSQLRASCMAPGAADLSATTASQLTPRMLRCDHAHAASAWSRASLASTLTAAERSGASRDVLLGGASTDVVMQASSLPRTPSRQARVCSGEAEPPLRPALHTPSKRTAVAARDGATQTHRAVPVAVMLTTPPRAAAGCPDAAQSTRPAVRARTRSPHVEEADCRPAASGAVSAPWHVLVPTEASLARSRDIRAAADAAAAARATAAKLMQVGPGAAAYVPVSARARSQRLHSAPSVSAAAAAEAAAADTSFWSSVPPPRPLQRSWLAEDTRRRRQQQQQQYSAGLPACWPLQHPAWAAGAPHPSGPPRWQPPPEHDRGPEALGGAQAEIDAARRSFQREDPSVADALRFVVAQLGELRGAVASLGARLGPGEPGAVKPPRDGGLGVGAAAALGSVVG